jgi:hypothetical protein
MKISPTCKAAILLVSLAAAQGAYAHGIAGNRYFDSKLTFDDLVVADEAILPTLLVSQLPGSGHVAPGARAVTAEICKRKK